LRYLLRDGAAGNQALAVNLDAQRRIGAAKAKSASNAAPAPKL